jgi:hypothetical protein
MPTTNAERLEVHVFGGGEGESIVLGLPNGGWGVIDCFATKLEEPKTNASLQFLLSRGVSSLDFL